MEAAKKIVRFEDLNVWKLSMELSKEIFELSQDWRFFSLKDQIQRASLSVSSNIAEGFERNSDKELCQFFYYAKGSAGELRTQLYLAQALNLISENEAGNLISKARTISSMLYHFIKSKKEH